MAGTRPPRTRRRLALVLIVCTVLGAAAGAAWSATQLPVYTAQTVVRVAAVSGTSTVVSGPLSMAYADAAGTDAVLDPAIKRIGTERPAAELKAGTHVATLDSGLVEITVTSPGAGTSAALANSIATQLAAGVPAEATAIAGGRTIQVQAVLAATRPTSPDGMPTALSTLFGAIAGLSVGLLVALLLNAGGRLGSRRLRSAQDVARLTRRPVLGTVPVFDAKGAVPAAEALGARVGLLRAALEPRLVASRSQVLLVTSTRRGEGRTSLIAALGASMALEGRSVLAVDLDLQRPHLAQAFGLPTAHGIADVLRGAAALQDVVEVHRSGCIVVGAGDDAVEAAVSASTNAIDEAFRRFRAEVDTVLVDGPPVNGSASTLPLTREADGALVVVTLGRTRETELTALLNTLDASGVTVVGVVLETRVRRAVVSRTVKVDAKTQTPILRTALDPADFPPPTP